MGTAFSPDFEGAAIVLEDVDRMLTQLIMAGVVFGEVVGCEPEREGQLKDVTDDFVARVSCPVFCGLPMARWHLARKGVQSCDLRA